MRLLLTGFFSARLPVCAMGLGLWLVFGAGALLSAASNELGHPAFREFPPGRSKITHLCQAVTQDADGFIYIANSTGLQFFDGHAWQPIPVPNEAAGARKFAITADGTIYVGGAGMLGWLRTTGERKEYVSLIDQLPEAARGFDDIYDVLAVGDAVYFATANKILVWRSGDFAVIASPTPPNSYGARLHRIGNEVYVTALDHPLRRLVRDKLVLVADHPVFHDHRIISLEREPHGELVLLTAENGFYRLTGDQLDVLPVEANRWLVGKRIICSQRLSDGSLAVAFSPVSGDGGMRFNAAGQYVGPIDQYLGLYVKTLRAFFHDREGGLWLGTETGLFRLVWPSAVSVFDAINGLGQGAVTDVTRHAGTLYATTSEGIYRLAPSDDGTGQVARFERVSQQPTYALLSHPAGLLVLGYTDLLAQTPTGFVSIATLPPGGGTLQPSKQNPERIWIATARGIQSLLHTAEGWRDEGPLQGFTEPTLSLTEATDGSLWVSTVRAGLQRVAFAGEGISSPHAERFGIEAGLPPDFTTGTTADWAGEPIFFLGNSPRPLRFNSPQHRFTVLFGTELWPANVLKARASSQVNPAGRSEAWWLANADGIYRAPNDGSSIRRLPHLVLATSGTVSRLYEETGPDGAVLWIAGTQGLVRVKVADAFPAPVPFQTLLKARGVAEGTRLPPDHDPLGFSFVAPRHEFTDAVTYRSRLIGLESDWPAWSTERKRSFTRLPAGDYRFEVQAQDGDGQLSAPGALSFAVLPPWWLTTWALLAYVVSGAGLVAGLVRWSTHALHQRAARLEGLIAERTAELAHQNTELVRLNQLELDEKISARLAEEKARLEVLRYQLNPHFLFNTLASISSSLPSGPNLARTMVERLAEFCRLTLHRKDDRDWTTLGEELHLLRAYLEIERSRWGDLLEVEIECEPALADERLPHFLLLPLVENALKYGRATSPDRVGLRLVARRGSDGGLILLVANTGEWIEPATRKSVSSLGIGLDNLRERLLRHYPRTHQLDIAHADGWVTVTLRLAPFRAG